MKGCEVRVAFVESERAEGKAESYVVDGVGFGGGGCLGVGDRDFDLLSHDDGTIVDAWNQLWVSSTLDN